MRNRINIVALLLFMMTLPWQLHSIERMDLLKGEPFIIRISNIPAFLKALEQSAPGKLWNSREMKPFLNDQSLGEAVKASFLDSMFKGKPNARQLAHLMWEQYKMLNGELVVGIASAKDGGVRISIVGSIDKDDFERSLEIDDRMAELDDDAGDAAVEEFLGVRLIRRDYKRSEGTVTSWIAFFNGTLINGDKREWVEQCIITLKKETVTEPLGSPSLHLRITDRILREFLFPNRPGPSLPGHLEEGGGGEEGTPPPPAQAAPASPAPRGPEPEAIIKALGFDKLEYLSLDVVLNPGNLEFVFQVKQVPSSDPARGVWALLVPETGAPSPDIRLPYVPEDIYSYQVIPLNFGALWKEIPEILHAMNPQNAAKFQGSLDMFAAMYKVDPGRDIFANLGNHLITFTRMEGIKKQDIYAFRLRNPLVMEKALGKLLGEGSMIKAQVEDILEVHDLGGYKLYSLKIPSVPALPHSVDQPEAEAAPPAMVFNYISLAVIDGYFAIGDDKLVRGLIQGASGKEASGPVRFYKSALYTEAVRNLPEGAVGFAMTDISRYLKPLMTFFKSTIPARVLENGTPGASRAADKRPDPLEAFVDGLRFELMPGAEFLSSFFGKGISYTHQEKGGMVTRTIVHYPGDKQKDR